MAARDDAAEAPQIAASVIVGLRHLLIDSGIWQPVRAALAARDPRSIEWIETELAVDPTTTAWVTSAHFGDLMDTILEVVGSDRAFELGRERLHRSAQAGAFAPVVRSWMRSFGESPEEFLRLTIHAWSSQTRSFGVVSVVENRPGHARFVMLDAPEVIRDSAGWHRFLSGYGTGLLDLIHRQGQCAVRRDPSGKSVEIVFDYTGPASGTGDPSAA
jgi:hypothetical protein